MDIITLTQRSPTDDLQKWLSVLRHPLAVKQTGELEKHPGGAGISSWCRCCLGHLCYALDVPRHTREEPESMIYYGETDPNKKHDHPDHSDGLLPRTTAKRMDITVCGAFVEDIWVRGGKWSSLADLNDGSNLSPKEIADVIETQWSVGNFKTYEQSFSE